jgi:hypothetical protein
MTSINNDQHDNFDTHSAHSLMDLTWFTPKKEQEASSSSGMNVGASTI